MRSGKCLFTVVGQFHRERRRDNVDGVGRSVSEWVTMAISRLNKQTLHSPSAAQKQQQEASLFSI